MSPFKSQLKRWFFCVGYIIKQVATKEPSLETSGLVFKPRRIHMYA